MGVILIGLLPISEKAPHRAVLFRLGLSLYRQGFSSTKVTATVSPLVRTLNMATRRFLIAPLTERLYFYVSNI